jgi:methionyl-tRNA formyltransferase
MDKRAHYKNPIAPARQRDRKKSYNKKITKKQKITWTEKNQECFKKGKGQKTQQSETEFFLISSFDHALRI